MTSSPNPKPAEVEDLHQAQILRATGRLDDAEALVRSIVGSNPGLAVAHDHLGRVHQVRGKFSLAMAAYQRALEIDPERAETYLQIGLVRERQGALDAAAECYVRAATLDTSSPLPVLNLGLLALGAGRTLEAIAHLSDAVERAPSLPIAHEQLAFALLQHGELGRGFEELEWRFEHSGDTPLYSGTGAPVWDASPDKDATLMIICEQGFGTRMQFIRYAALAAKRLANVVCLGSGPEARFLATCPGVDRVYTPDESLPHFDIQAPVVSLARIFGTTLDTIPADVPYLNVPVGVSVDETLLGAGDHMRIGFVWASGEEYQGPSRDVPLDMFAPIAALEGVRLFSFQHDERHSALKVFGADVVDLASSLGDFAQTAAYTVRMDLIITVDTAMAHLAGSLGVPVWLLLTKHSEWRWLEGREDSPWYPTVRIFRQDHTDEWAPVFSRVVSELHERLSDGDIGSRL